MKKLPYVQKCHRLGLSLVIDSNIHFRQGPMHSVNSSILDFNNLEIENKLASALNAELPSHGFIAGAGLASIVLTTAWDRSFPIGSIEHFTDWPYEPVDPEIPLCFSRPSLGEENYLNIVPNGYRIISTDVHGKLVSHVIQREQPGFGTDRIFHVLHALELNALAVGFDCYNKQLVITDAFIDFCRTQQLRIQSPVKAENLLSLLFYRDLFGCYADVQEEVAFLSGFRVFCRQNLDTGSYDDRISPFGVGVYYRFKNDLDIYCHLIEPLEPALPGLEEHTNSSGIMVLKRDTIPHGELLADLCRFLSNNNEIGLFAFSALFNACVRKSSSRCISNRFSIAVKYTSTFYMIASAPACLEYDFNEKHAQIIDEFNNDHSACFKVLLGLNLDIYSMSQAILRIINFAKKNGNMVIGLIESHKRANFKLREISDQSLECLLDAYRELAGRPLLERPADLKDFEFKSITTELTTTTDLECEGWKMRSCVGGYGGIVYAGKGNVRIFHLDGKNPSTVAIHYNPESESFFCEIAGFANCEAAEEHVLISDKLGDYLCRTIWRKKVSSPTLDDE